MNLRKFEFKNVRMVCTDGDVFEGFVGDYIFPEDNEPEGIEGIVLDNAKRINNDVCSYDYPVGFNADEIKSIEIIK